MSPGCSLHIGHSTAPVPPQVRHSVPYMPVLSALSSHPQAQRSLSLRFFIFTCSGDLIRQPLIMLRMIPHLLSWCGKSSAGSPDISEQARAYGF